MLYAGRREVVQPAQVLCIICCRLAGMMWYKKVDSASQVWINSPGGDVFAAAQIYNMLMEYKGDVTVKVDALAASAASVIAMAGTEVLMSPVGMMMIHNPMTIAIGDSKEMQRAGEMLDEVKESIMNAYEIKVEALEEENFFRSIATVIWTSSGNRKIPVVATKGTASWIDEEEGRIGYGAMPAQNAGAVLARFRECRWAAKREIGQGSKAIQVSWSR